MRSSAVFHFILPSRDAMHRDAFDTPLSMYRRHRVRIIYDKFVIHDLARACAGRASRNANANIRDGLTRYEHFFANDSRGVIKRAKHEIAARNSR